MKISSLGAELFHAHRQTHYEANTQFPRFGENAEKLGDVVKKV